jgi:alanyl-tRNA synthetase
MFIDTGMPPCGPECRPGCGCGKYVEIWNDVFMIYERQPDGSYRELKQKNIDTGMGVERTVMVLEGKQSVFATSVFAPLRAALKEENLPVKSRRIILDHLRASVHIMGDERGVSPSNREQGYIVRRLLRRSIRLLRQTELDAAEIAKRLCAVARAVVREDGEQGPYKELLERRSFIEENIAGEVARFTHTLAQGERRLAKMLSRLQGKVLSGAEAFELYESCGFPLELTEEIAAEQGYKVDRRGFYAAQEEHRRKSRGTGARFAGGLADHSPAVVRLHTATHLLHAALRRVLGKHVRQKGSNITRERLRFDFTHPQALTAKEIKRVEEMVNEQIRRDIPVERKEMSLAKAKTLGALGFFEEKYGERVSVYRIGDFSLEICGGPHVRRTGELGTFRIVEEEALGAGVRRLRAILEKS